MSTEEKNLEAEVTVKFKIKDIICESDVKKFYKGDFNKYVKDLIDEEGLFGIVEDDWKILSITKINPL